MITLTDIKKEWENTQYTHDQQISLEQYIQENYTQVYDEKLNFIGYELGVIHHECL